MRSGVERAVRREFERQVDLRFAQRFKGSEIVANDSWLPVAGAVSSIRWVAASRAPASTAESAAASAPTDPGRAGALASRRPGTFSGAVAPTARSLLLAQEYSPHWRASAGGARIAPARSFGWATSFQLTGSGAAQVDVVWRGQALHRLLLLGEFVLVGLIGAAWSRRAARERGER
jgi:hypothetical protein